jgi:pantoate--beta-alanine ligase
MKIVNAFEEIWRVRRGLTGSVGFVPTMGYLHEGHLSLVRKARLENDHVVVSIFVNPTQFAPDEDLGNYPRDVARDTAFLEDEQIDILWHPSSEVLYPDHYQTWVVVENITRLLEGSYRPTHFKGVTTIVSKLFNAVQPDRAYFGQKDAQQAVVIKQMTRDLNYPLKIVVCPIVREPDGLAMSSRNMYLDPDQRKAAVCLSRGLIQARDAFQNGETEADHLRTLVVEEVNNEPLAQLQYVSCADPVTLEEIEGQVVSALVSLAVFVGKTRLIDNILLPETGSLGIQAEDPRDL